MHYPVHEFNCFIFSQTIIDYFAIITIKFVLSLRVILIFLDNRILFSTLDAN